MESNAPYFKINPIQLTFIISPLKMVVSSKIIIIFNFANESFDFLLVDLSNSVLYFTPNSNP